MKTTRNFNRWFQKRRHAQASTITFLPSKIRVSNVHVLLVVNYNRQRLLRHQVQIVTTHVQTNLLLAVVQVHQLDNAIPLALRIDLQIKTQSEQQTRCQPARTTAQIPEAIRLI